MSDIPHYTWKEWLAAAPEFKGDAVVIEESEPLSLDDSVKKEWPKVKFTCSGKAKWRDVFDEGPTGRIMKSPPQEPDHAPEAESDQ